MVETLTQTQDTTRSSSEVGLLGGAMFLHYWPAIERQLDFVPHIWADLWTKDSICDCVLRDQWQCWAVAEQEGPIRAIIFTSVIQYPANRVFEIVLAFGEGLMEFMPEIFGAFEKFASDRECTLARTSGRPGWGPELKRLGFQQKSTVFVRTVRKLTVN